jgi:hypothetical protein
MPLRVYKEEYADILKWLQKIKKIQAYIKLTGSFYKAVSFEGTGNSIFIVVPLAILLSIK